MEERGLSSEERGLNCLSERWLNCSTLAAMQGESQVRILFLPNSLKVCQSLSGLPPGMVQYRLLASGRRQRYDKCTQIPKNVMYREKKLSSGWMITFSFWLELSSRWMITFPILFGIIILLITSGWMIILGVIIWLNDFKAANYIFSLHIVLFPFCI